MAQPLALNIPNHSRKKCLVFSCDNTFPEPRKPILPLSFGPLQSIRGGSGCDVASSHTGEWVSWDETGTEPNRPSLLCLSGPGKGSIRSIKSMPCFLQHGWVLIPCLWKHGQRQSRMEAPGDMESRFSNCMHQVTASSRAWALWYNLLRSCCIRERWWIQVQLTSALRKSPSCLIKMYHSY